MLSTRPNSPSDLESSASDGNPGVVYDLETGGVVVTHDGAPGAPPPEPKDPLMRDLEGVLANFHAIGNGFRTIQTTITRSVTEFRTTYSAVQSDRGILSVFLHSLWDDATQRLWKITTVAAAVLCVPLFIVILVKTHKNPPRPRATQSAEINEERAEEVTMTPSQRAVLAKSFGDPAADVTAKSGLPQSDMRDLSADPTWQALKTRAALLIAHLQLNSVRTQDSVSDLSSMTPSAPTPSARPTTSGTTILQGSIVKFLLPPGRVVSSALATPTSAGTGAKQFGTEEGASDSAAPDLLTNGDENGVMDQLYKEYAAHPHSALGKTAGIYLAELYWYRAGDDFHHGRKAQALTDWKRVAKFDPTAPIAAVARQKMRVYGAKHSKKTTAAHRNAPSKKASARKRQAGTILAKRKS